MDLTHIILTLVVIFLAHVEVRSWRRPNKPSYMQSFYRLNNCSGGNLLDLHQCTEGLCEAKLDGSSTGDHKTNLNIKEVGKGKNIKCIEFNGYALKVLNSNDVAFSKKQGCVDNVSSEFQFHEEEVNKKHRVYKYKIGDNTKCLGLANATCHDATLSLINTTENSSHNRLCYFGNP